jgi:hypothetical protein
LRSVITEKDIATIKKIDEAKAAALEKEKDDYISQLAKFIPAEVVSFYTAILVSAQAITTELPDQNVYWLMFAMGLIATIIFSYANNKKELRRDDNDIPGQLIKPTLTTIAFVIWAFTLGTPFDQIPGYHPFYGTLLMTFYTLITPKIYEIIPQK